MPTVAGSSARSVGRSIPRVCSEVLRRFGMYRVPLIVTENGIATSDEALRVSFIEAHVRSLARAMSDGANVLGYFYWTLFDNYAGRPKDGAHTSGSQPSIRRI